MMSLLRPVALALALLAPGLLTSCQTTRGGGGGDWQGIQSSRVAMLNAIQTEQPGDYYIGRRFYKRDYKFWGFVRRPGQPWSTAQLVMLNEQGKLAPDREQGAIGSDNDYEYKLLGEFSGQSVYEPASNGKYPEFTLRGYELRSVSPGKIFNVPGATDPSRRIIPKPY
jgi:hypothetical protein